MLGQCLKVFLDNDLYFLVYDLYFMVDDLNFFDDDLYFLVDDFLHVVYYLHFLVGDKDISFVIDISDILTITCIFWWMICIF